MERPTLIPLFIEAKTKEELVSLMLKNNLSKGFFFRYFDIQFVRRRWIAWYYDNVDSATIRSNLEVLRGGK